MKRTDKITVLEQVLQGDTHSLRTLQTSRGKRWRTDQRAAQRTYLTTLLGHDPTEADLLCYFGAYDRSAVPGAVGIEYAEGLYGYIQ